MFEGRKVAFESPRNALFYFSDYASCKAANDGRSVGGKQPRAQQTAKYTLDGRGRHIDGGRRRLVNTSAKNSTHMGMFVIFVVTVYLTS